MFTGSVLRMIHRGWCCHHSHIRSMKVRLTAGHGVSVSFTMQRELLTPPFYQRLCGEASRIVLHFTFILQGRHKKAGSRASHPRLNALPPAEMECTFASGKCASSVPGGWKAIQCCASKNPEFRKTEMESIKVRKSTYYNLILLSSAMRSSVR
jgi:hypothetical protein